MKDKVTFLENIEGYCRKVLSSSSSSNASLDNDSSAKFSTILALEPRIVFDGAATSIAVEALDIVADDALDIVNVAEQAGVIASSDQASMQVAFIEMSLPDAQQIAEGLNVDVTVIWIDPGGDGVEQISSALEALGTMDAIHIFTHGDDGSFSLGNQLVTNDTLSEVEDSFADWAQYLSADADILFYGCDLAESLNGQALINSIANITGADIAASTNLTGSQDLGGDWVLEYNAGDIETEVAATELLQANFSHVLAGEPQATLTGPAVDPLIGEAITFTVSFDNINATDPGFAPYVNLIMPSLGVDGDNMGEPSDGISFVSATYLGQAVGANVITLVDMDLGTAGIQFNHPEAVDAAGDPLVVTIDPALGVQEGDQLVVLTLPFGSVTASLPILDIQVTANVSANADVGTGLDVIANAGFKYGNDALDNPATDPSIQAVTLNAGTTDSITITPQLYRMTTTLNAPEAETATGQNYQRSYDIEVEVAAGQTIDAASIDFTFDERMIYVSGSSTGGGVLDTGNLGQALGGNLADDVLTVDFAALSGTQTVTANFYVGEFDQLGANVLNAVTGTSVLVGENNNVGISGSWDPNDARDAITPIANTQTATQITAKSIAVQKVVAISNDLNAVGATSGDTLHYTVDIQVSDYFAFNDITLEDIFEDGQLLTGTPIVDVVRQAVADPQQSFTLGVDLTDTTLVNDDHDLDFDVSALIIGGVLEGGYFNADTLGATTVQIQFDTVIQDEYDSNAGNLNVKQGDTLDNDVTVTGDVLDSSFFQVGNQVTDISHAEVTVPNNDVTLSIYAVGGVQGAFTSIKPGDDVTFRLEYDLVTGDFENFDISSYLPLPVFDVDDLNADGAGGDIFGVDGVNAIPTVGLLRFGPTATADVIVGGVPVVTPDIVGNSLGFDFGDLSDPTNDGGKIDVLFTLRVTNEPFADNLLLTTLSQQGDDNSPSATNTSDDLDQITLQQPVIENIIKAVVETNVGGGDSFNPVYSADDPTGFFRNAGNGNANPLLSNIGSDTLDATNFDNDLLDGVDDGDLVRFAIIIENTGTSPNGAFDVTIEDAMPAGFVVPGGGINLRVVDGTGATVTVETASPDTALFAGGITLQDGVTGAISEFHATDGSNIIIITYDLEVVDASEAASTHTNTATLTNYANTEGGPDFTAEDITDTADVIIASATMNKFITDTDIPATAGSNLAIGEVVEYTLIITVPEGTTSSALLVDTLDQGLAFVGINSITINSGDLTTDVVGGTATILAGAAFGNVGGGADNDARSLTLNFGNLTNLNSNNGTDETITVVYEAVAVNVASTNNGDIVRNSAVWTSLNNGVGVTERASAFIVEADVGVTITPDATQFDAGDTVTWTVVVEADALRTVDAFEVDFNNTIPAGLTYVGASLSNTAGVVPDSVTENGGDFNATFASLTPGQTSTFTFQTTVDIGAGFGQAFTDSGTVTWHSIDGALVDPSTLTTVDTERTGAGGVNDLTNTGTADVDVLLASPQLFLDSTSEVVNGNNATIGEIVRYRYKMAVPESTSTDLRVEAALPTGLQFLDDGTATVAFVADGVGFTSSTIVGANMVGDETTVDLLEPTVVLASGVDVSAGPFGSGDNPQFLLGDVVNNDNDVNVEFVIIEFNALVLNTSDNNAGDTIGVDARVLTGAVTEIYGTDDVIGVGVNVVEPVLSALDKSVIDTDGTTATYQVTFANTSGQAAFEINVLDVLPANINNLGNVTVVSSVGVAGVVDNSTVAQLDMDLASMANGGSITITYTADVIDNTIVVADTDVDITWTGISGGISTLGISTAGASGTTFGERTGDGIGENDYAAAEGAGLGILRGTLWEDINLDDVIGAEPLLNGVQINLTLAGVDGIIGNGDDVVFSDITDINGDYLFGALPAWLYEISVQPNGQPNGLGPEYSHTYDTTGSGLDNLITNTLTDGQDVSGQNFGVGISELGGTLWYDVNSDTIIGAEPFIDAVQINLLYAGADGIFGNGDDAIFTDITDINGDYSFTGLRPGNYRVDVQKVGLNSLDPNFVSSYDVTGSLTDNLIDVALGAGVKETGQNFGVGIGEISGVLFEDLDLSTTINVGDILLGNVQVNLLYAGADGIFGNGDDATFTDLTNGIGEYNFTNLQPGNYRVDVEKVGPNPLNPNYASFYDPSGAASDNLIDVALGAGIKVVDQNFAVGIGGISGTLFEDIDLSSTVNVGDILISGVQINMLYAGADGIFGNGDDQTFSDVTDVNGDYSFINLQPGNYRLDVQKIGVNALHSDYSSYFDVSGSATDNQIDVVLGAALVETGQNFGVAIGGIEGTLYNDINASNTIDGGDLFFSNIQINMLYAGADGIFGNGDDVIYTDITDALGYYSIDAIQPGNYRIDVQKLGLNSLDPIFSSTFDPSGAPNDNLINLVLPSGTIALNQDFAARDLPTPPEAVDRSYAITNDKTQSFQASHFDYYDQDGHAFDNVRIDTLPVAGSFTLSGVPIVLGQIIPVVNIPDILFTPGITQTGTVDFTFSVQDSFGDFDLIPNTFTITITDPVVVFPPVVKPPVMDTTPIPPNNTSDPISLDEFFEPPKFDYFFNHPLIREVNHPEFWLAGNVEEKIIIETEAFIFKVSKGIFKHLRPGENLTFEAKMADDSPLPDWLGFDPESLTYKGTPPLGSPEALETVIIARDSKGNEVKAPVRILINNDIEEEDELIVPQERDLELPVKPTDEVPQDENIDEEAKEESSIGRDYLNFSEQLHNQTRLSQVQKDIAFIQAISVVNPSSGV